MKTTRTALVVGGSGGIGQAVVQLLAAQGLKVFATYHRAKDKIIEQKNLSWLQCDLTSAAEVDKTVAEIINSASHLDIVVNAATSSLKLKLFEKISSAGFREDIQVILLGAANLLQQVVPLMKKQRSGTIINLLSATVESSPARMSSYVAAKAGLLGLSKCLAAELKAFNVGVFAVSPSYVETDLLSAFPAKLLEIERDRQPGKEFIQPVDVAVLIYNIIENPAEFALHTIVYSRKEIGDLNEKYGNQLLQPGVAEKAE